MSEKLIDQPELRFITDEELLENPVLLTNPLVRSNYLDRIYSSYGQTPELIGMHNDFLFNMTVGHFYETAKSKKIKPKILFETEINPGFLSKILGIHHIQPEFGWKLFDHKIPGIDSDNLHISSVVLNNGLINCKIDQNNNGKINSFLVMPSYIPKFHFINASTANGAKASFEKLDIKLDDLLNQQK